MNYNQNSGYGKAMLNAVSQIIPTFGRIFVVFSSSDSANPAYQMWQEICDQDPNGKLRFYTDPIIAYNAMTNNNNDIMLLDGSASHTLSEMMVISKNRINIIGMDGGGRMYGQGAKLSMGVTTAATDIAAFKNTGVRNSFRNIKYSSANTKAESLYSVVEAGEYALYENCEIYKETDLDVTGAAELVLNGDSAQFRKCTIGSLANDLSGDVIRANVLLTKGLGGSGKVCRDSLFEDCLFWKKASHVNNRFVYGANADDVERLLMFKNCSFINAKLAAALPAQAVASGSSLTAGYILLKDCAQVNCTKLSTTTGVIVAGPAYSNATGISVNAA